MTLVSSANIMGIDEVFSVGGRLFMKTRKSKDPKIDPWGTPLFPSLSRFFVLNLMVLFQSFVLC
jgi:hypothetical protein